MRSGCQALIFWCLTGCTTSAEVGRFAALAGEDAGALDSGADVVEAPDAVAEAAAPDATDGSIDVAPPPARLSLALASTCALDAQGRVRCWGDNSYGQLGINSDTPSLSTAPLETLGLAPGTQGVFGGTYAHCAIAADRRAQCWGDSVFGNFVSGGRRTMGTHAISYGPLEAPGLANIAMMAIGTYFHCALLRDGTVKCYGLNGAGQLGSGNLNDSYIPADVLGAGPSIHLSAAQSGFFACAVGADGKVRCWGQNQHGQLGDGSTTDALAAVEVTGLPGKATRVAAGRDHACAIAAADVYCWGGNANGQLGGVPSPDQTSPVQISGLSGAKEVAAGLTHTCVLLSDGSVSCFGDFGGVVQAPTQVIVGGAVEVSAGGHHACALLQGEILRCWGQQLSGELGPFAGQGAPL